MKKFLLALLACIPLFGDWVLIGQQQASTTTGITFTNLFKSYPYEDYLFVIDMIEPLGGYADVVMQFSNTGGSSWITNYSGGISSYGAGSTSINSNAATSVGIPLTDVNNAGYTFIGHVYLSNVLGTHNYGPLSIHGEGNFGTGNAAAHVYGNCNCSPMPDSVQFVSITSKYPTINRISITVYGLTEF